MGPGTKRVLGLPGGFANNPRTEIGGPIRSVAIVTGLVAIATT